MACEPLRCSFCRKSQDVVGKLVGSPSDYPRAYICDECIAVCACILEDDRDETQRSLPDMMLKHPMARELMDAVSQWIERENSGQDASAELTRVRDIGQAMML